jgi:hypothetical protein
LIRSTIDIIVRTSAWSSITRTRGMKNPGMGRATAYDEKAGRTRNAAGIIRRFGKRVVT